MAFAQFQEMCEAQGYDECVDGDEITAAFGRLDVDTSGSIEYPEFLEWWRTEYGQAEEPETWQTEHRCSFKRAMALKFQSEGERELVRTARDSFVEGLGAGIGALDKERFRLQCYLQGYCLSQDELDRAFDAVDLDGSGSVDFTEYFLWFRRDDRFQHLLHGSDEKATLIRQTGEFFMHYDTNWTGLLDAEQFSKLHQSLLDNGCASESLEEAMAQADVNGDGQISLNEFLRWYCADC